MTLHVLVAGDSFVPAAVFRDALAGVDDVTTTFFDVDESRTPALPGLREYAGDPLEIAERLDGHDVLLVHGAPVTADVLDAAPGLRLVGCARGGPVNVDIGAATARGVPVVTTPGKNAEAVAELTVAFLVMLVRGIPKALAGARNGGGLGASTFEGAAYLGRELQGATLGLVGCGKVGVQVARRCRALGMRVLVHDPYLDDVPPEAERVDGLDALLAAADIVSLHARATPQTESLLDAAALARMRPGALLVNTARETLIDEDAVVAALESGHLGGVALDVLRHRDDGATSPLVGRDDVILTPHIGGATAETLERGATMLVAELRAFAAGEPLRNVANPEVLER
jgi:D-3-phosphoglycerate dehydrogenase / 2-oxoglutarate reductase